MDNSFDASNQDGDREFSFHFNQKCSNACITLADGSWSRVSVIGITHPNSTSSPLLT